MAWPSLGTDDNTFQFLFPEMVRGVGPGMAGGRRSLNNMVENSVACVFSGMTGLLADCRVALGDVHACGYPGLLWTTPKCLPVSRMKLSNSRRFTGRAARIANSNLGLGSNAKVQVNRQPVAVAWTW